MHALRLLLEDMALDKDLITIITTNEARPLNLPTIVQLTPWQALGGEPAAKRRPRPAPGCASAPVSLVSAAEAQPDTWTGHSSQAWQGWQGWQGWQSSPGSHQGWTWRPEQARSHQGRQGWQSGEVETGWDSIWSTPGGLDSLPAWNEAASSQVHWSSTWS